MNFLFYSLEAKKKGNQLKGNSRKKKEEGRKTKDERRKKKEESDRWSYFLFPSPSFLSLLVRLCAPPFPDFFYLFLFFFFSSLLFHSFKQPWSRVSLLLFFLLFFFSFVFRPL